VYAQTVTLYPSKYTSDLQKISGKWVDDKGVNKQTTYTMNVKTIRITAISKIINMSIHA